MDTAREINISVLRLMRDEKDLIIADTEEGLAKAKESADKETVALNKNLKEIDSYFYRPEGKAKLGSSRPRPSWRSGSQGAPGGHAPRQHHR